METMISVLENSAVFKGDIILFKNEEQHLRNLVKILHRLRDFGLHLKIQICYYLENIINEHGINPGPARIQSVICLHF